MKALESIKVHLSQPIRDALKVMDGSGIGIVICIDDADKVVGVATDGDFRRAILNDLSLQAPISQIYNRNFSFLTPDYREPDLIAIFKKTGGKPVPILENSKLVDIVTEQEFFKIAKGLKKDSAQLSLPVVIMAGGKGARLDPFTRILPKPLIPIGDKPVIEIIMDRFAACGIVQFYISVNHKKKMLKAYLDETEKSYNIQYIEEEEPLGTAGALKTLEGVVATPFFVSNCDILIDTDYHSIYEFHQKGDYALTLVASIQHHTIPYGVCEIAEGGRLKSITEKPEYDFLVNTGLYLLNPETLKYIPQEQRFDMTDLIAQLQKNGEKVGAYPVSEKSWLDVGQWEAYKKSMDVIGRI